MDMYEDMDLDTSWEYDFLDFEFDMDTIFLAYLGVVAVWEGKGARGKARRWWIHPIFQRREQHGVYYRLVKELELDSQRWREYLRLSREQFEVILAFVTGINHKETHEHGGSY